MQDSIRLYTMPSIVFQLPSSDLLTGIIALVAVLGMVTGVVRWLHRRRWKGVRSAREQEAYLRDSSKVHRMLKARLLERSRV